MPMTAAIGRLPPKLQQMQKPIAGSAKCMGFSALIMGASGVAKFEMAPLAMKTTLWKKLLAKVGYVLKPGRHATWCERSAIFTVLRPLLTRS